jgi:glycosyltransferase involved in cell wall biosynthesis
MGWRYRGERPRGLVIVNMLERRGRRLGADIVRQVRHAVPLDLIGMESERMGGLGEVSHGALPDFTACYCFLFNPIRYTSLGLAVCEAMMLGVPVVALATTELATVVENGISGYIDTSVDRLIGRMHDLLDDPRLAKRLGMGARETAVRRFSLARFVAEWDDAFRAVTAARDGRERVLTGIRGGAA